MEQLLFLLLKGLLKLVLYAVTGKWVDLDKLKEQLLEQAKQRSPEAPGRRARPARPVFQRKAGGPTSRPIRPSARTAQQGDEPEQPAWPFAFEDELRELESDDELLELESDAEEQGGEQPVQHHAQHHPTFKRRPMPGLAKPGVTAKPRSLARAFRDPHTVREAIVLGAALGRRGPRL